MAIERSRPKIAIVGAGLAGLSAAYYLRNKAEVTIFEASERAGGRVLTSPHPRGEHGAEFLLKSEGKICGLLKAWRVKRSPIISGWPGYLFRGHLTWGKPDRAIMEELLSSPSAVRVIRLFNLVKRGSWHKKCQPADRWLSWFFRRDKQAIQFVSMLLAGETCAPLSHLRAEYVLECLWSFLDDDEWYRIHGGSKKLVDAFLERSQSHLKVTARVNRVLPVRGGVRVRWVQNGNSQSAAFDAVIVATPEGERLFRKRPCGHFHAYISVLVRYCVRPQVKGYPKFDLASGLYMNGPLNYLQLTKRAGSSHVLRILLPNAESKLRWTNRQIVGFCLKHLRKILTNHGRMRVSVKRWKFGLPCGGAKEILHKASGRICLAGDRFGEWPSMNAAIESGQFAAEELLKNYE